MSLDWMAIFTLNEQLMAFLCIESLEAVVRPLGPCSNKRSSLHRVVNVLRLLAHA
jgi:hypothetical protein